jgi:hypothetical protein
MATTVVRGDGRASLLKRAENKAPKFLAATVSSHTCLIVSCLPPCTADVVRRELTVHGAIRRKW